MSRIGAKKGLGFHCTRRKRRGRWREPRYILPDEVEALREEIARESRIFLDAPSARVA